MRRKKTFKEEAHTIIDSGKATNPIWIVGIPARVGTSASSRHRKTICTPPNNLPPYKHTVAGQFAGSSYMYTLRCTHKLSTETLYVCSKELILHPDGPHTEFPHCLRIMPHLHTRVQLDSSLDGCCGKNERWQNSGHSAEMPRRLPPCVVPTEFYVKCDLQWRGNREKHCLHTVVLHMDGEKKLRDPGATLGDIADNDATISVQSRSANKQARHQDMHARNLTSNCHSTPFTVPRSPN